MKCVSYTIAIHWCSVIFSSFRFFSVPRGRHGWQTGPPRPTLDPRPGTGGWHTCEACWGYCMRRRSGALCGGSLAVHQHLFDGFGNLSDKPHQQDGTWKSHNLSKFCCYESITKLTQRLLLCRLFGSATVSRVHTVKFQTMPLGKAIERCTSMHSQAHVYM